MKKAKETGSGCLSHFLPLYDRKKKEISRKLLKDFLSVFFHLRPFLHKILYQFKLNQQNFLV